MTPFDVFFLTIIAIIISMIGVMIGLTICATTKR